MVIGTKSTDDHNIAVPVYKMNLSQAPTAATKPAALRKTHIFVPNRRPEHLLHHFPDTLHTADNTHTG